MRYKTEINLQNIICLCLFCILCFLLVAAINIYDDFIYKQAEIINKLNKIDQQLKNISANETEKAEETKVSRSSSRKAQIMRITAYDLSYQSCGKTQNNPAYGVTASGAIVKEWQTIAAGPELPFGTKIYIPYFKNKPNGGIFVVTDRGGAINNSCLDVYMADYTDCMNFGVKNLPVYILEEKNG